MNQEEIRRTTEVFVMLADGLSARGISTVEEYILDELEGADLALWDEYRRLAEAWLAITRSKLNMSGVCHSCGGYCGCDDDTLTCKLRDSITSGQEWIEGRRGN